MKVKALLIMMIAVGMSALYAHGQVLKAKSSSVLNNPTVHWYGLDFSNTVIFDQTQLENGERIKKNVFIEWQAYFNKHVSDRKILRWFKKSELIDHRSKFYESHKSLDPETLVRGNMSGSISENRHVQEVVNQINRSENQFNNVFNELSLQHLDSCIASYELDETKGLGAIMIIEKMSKADKGTYVVGVLFDIATREILVAIRDKGAWDSYGFVAMYGSGINDGVSRIGDKYRRRVLK